MASGSERQSVASNGQHAPSRPAIAPIDDPQSTRTAARRTVSDGDILDARWSTVKKAAPDRALAAASRSSKLASAVPGIPAPGATISRENSPARSTARVNNNTTSPSATRKPSRTRQSSQDRSPNRSASGQSPGPTTHTQQRTSSQTLARPPLLTSSTSQSTASDTPTQDSSPEKTTSPWSAPTAPNIASKRSNPHLASDSDSHSKPDNHARERTPTAPRRAGNGAKISLETVQESASDPATPSADVILEPTSARKADTTDDGSRPQHVESGSDSSGRHMTGDTHDKRQPTPASSNTTTTGTRPLRTTHTASSEHLAKRSATSLSSAGAGARSKPADGSVRNMIVETETVSSIPQVSLGVGSGERGSSARVDAGGTLRMKPSSETIRPRKEKKRTTRKPASLAAGTASSKADIFEAKVASAVDEADVSDSDETFVYESNPPDPYPARQHRYHSRTPSATSMASQIDQLRLREGTHSVTGKRSMKFTNNNNNNNNTYTSSVDGDAADVDPGRSGSRVDGPNGSTQTVRHHQHQHIGRRGRNGGYPSLFDGESSPFPTAQSQQQPLPPSHSKSSRHFIGNGFRHARHPGSRVHPNYRTINGVSSSAAGDAASAVAAGTKGDDVYGFDFDAEGADDERTPLVGSGRAPRSRHGRRPNSASLRQMEYLQQQRKRNCCSRYGICALTVLLVMIIFAGGVSFILAVTKPLVEVQIVAVENVLASEQEIMLDLAVQASNPNLFPVAVDETDLNIFAKSRFVGTDRLWRDWREDDHRMPLSLASVSSAPRMERSQHRARLAHLAHSSSSPLPVLHPTDKVDKGTDPIPDPDPNPKDPSSGGGGGGGEPPTMLLGRVYHFDSPLVFDPSPWNHRTSRSTGQIRLARPGNKTEEGGTERWERVIQHPFELIVRGVIKYQLPLTSRVFSASVSSSAKVVPGEEDGGGGKSGNGTMPSSSSSSKLSRRVG